jgi:peptidoglycan/LPS O-acetylase OafA/YrhL
LLGTKENSREAALNSRIEELDGLRAVAVSSVVIFHVFGEKTLVGGYLGVDIFFVISGYLITGLLMAEFDRTRNISLQTFYMRRIRRIWPALSVLLLTVAAMATARILVFGADPDDWLMLSILSAVSIMNWARAFDYNSGGILGHMWSLSNEEQFYLIWPLLLIFNLRIFDRKFVLLFIGIAIIGSAGWRTYMTLHGASPDRTYNGLDTRADALLVGCFLAVYGISNIAPRTRAYATAMASTILITMLFFVPWTSLFMNTVGFTIAALCAATWVAAAVKPYPLVQTLVGSPPAVWLGLRSYSLYLWHYPIMTWILMGGVVSPVSQPITLVLSVLIADLSYRFIERPFQKGTTPGR